MDPPSQILKQSQQLYIIHSIMWYPAFCVVIWSWAVGLSYVIHKDLLWSKAWNGKWAQIFRFTQVKLTIDPPPETARALSEIFAVQCHQLEPIQNGQLIRKYKEIPVHIETIEIPKADDPLGEICQTTVWLHLCSMLLMIAKVRWIPPSPSLKRIDALHTG